MSLGDHININLKQGVKIITCEPATGTIEAETRNGEVIPINAYHQTPTFRWPVPGERWMVTEENGSWYLDGIYEQQGVEGSDVQAEPGDAVISTSSGRVLKNQEGKLSPIGISVGKLTRKELKQKEPHFYELPISSEARLVTFIIRGNSVGAV